MAALTTEEREAARSGLVGRLGDEGWTTDLLKADFRAAVAATDDWIDANAASFNAALPQPARNTLTAREKALLFMLVADRRFGVL